MRWACWRARRAWPVRTAKSCGPDPPTLGSSLCVTNAQATVAKKPGTPGRARDTPSNHCAGNAGCFGVPVVTAACFFCCRRAMGAASTRHSLRPLHPGGTRTMHHSGTSCRGNANARLLRNCEERKRRSNPDCISGDSLDCFAPLAMTTWRRCLICKSEPTRGAVTHVSGTLRYRISSWRKRCVRRSLGEGGWLRQAKPDLSAEARRAKAEG